MCDYCHSSPHRRGCPNAPEPDALYECEICGQDITESDTYAEIDGLHYHVDCLEGLSIVELLQLFKVDVYGDWI